MSADQREQLGRLTAIEGRVLEQLPTVDFSVLRSTTNARESGIELRGPDVVIAEHHVETLRAQVCQHLTAVAATLPSGREGTSTLVEIARRALDDLSRAVELIETTLYPRVNNPTLALAQAVERAVQARGQTATVDGDGETCVEQVRGLVRFLSELIASVGDNAYVHAQRDGGWLYVSIAPLATGFSDAELPRPRVELLRLAGYLLRIQAERVDGAWKLALVARDAP